MLPLFVIRAGCFKRDLLRKMVPGSDAGKISVGVKYGLMGGEGPGQRRRRKEMKKKTGKRILSFLMAVIVVIGSLQVPGLTLKAQAESSGSCGDHTTYTLEDSGVLTIDGIGSVTNFPWINSKVTKMVIKKDVTDIGADRLWMCGDLACFEVDGDNAVYSSDEAGVLFDKNGTKLINYPRGRAAENDTYTIPGSVKTIGEGAFANSELKTVIIPEGVLKIESNAFGNTYNLTSITLPDSLTTIESDAFGNSGLKTVIIPENVISIGDRAFWSDGISSIYVVAGNTVYSSDDAGVLFNKNKTTLMQYPLGRANDTYTVPETVKCIGSKAFYCCPALKNIILPQSVTDIKAEAFFNCENLSSINLPSELTELSEGVLSQTAITEIVIPESITAIDESAFEDCDKLTSVTIPENVVEIGERVFYGCDALAEVEICGNTVTIGSYAFGDCSSLESIIIPKNAIIEEDAFKDCEELKDVYYGGRAEDFDEKVTNNLIKDEKLIELYIEDKFHCAALAAQGNCGTDTKWELDSKGVLTISGTGEVSSAPWKDEHREAVKKVVIGKTVTDITKAELMDCDNLEEISVEAENAAYISEDGILFNNDKTKLIQYPCKKAESKYSIPDSVKCIGDYAFTRCGNLTDITIPDGVEKISDGAFSRCENLLGIIIPESVTDIGVAAFDRCKKISEICLPAGVTEIKKLIFRSCISLNTIIFTGTVTAIGDNAFQNCNALQDVYYPASWNAINSMCQGNGNDYLVNATFHPMKGDCGTNTAWTLTKDGLLTISGKDDINIDQMNVWNPDDVVQLVIEEGVTEIGYSAFEDNNRLTSIYIPLSLKSVLSNAFNGCISLSDVYYDGTDEDWNRISIEGNGNDCLLGADMHCIVLVTGVTVLPETLSLGVGESSILTANVAPENATNKKVSWASSVPTVATVVDGVVTAVAKGETIITVRTEDGAKTATCKLTVLEKDINVSGVSITPETLSLKVGESGTVIATVSPENATNKKVSWTSSTPEVATVADGVVTAVAEGESIITVTTEDGAKKATCKVTVSSKDINVSEVSITPETLSLKIGESGTLTATVSPENATNKKLNWTSSAEAVATVADGVVTAVAAGESIITVTSEDGGKTATCKVTVTKAEEVVDPEDPEKTSEPKIPEGPLGPEKPDLSRYTASGNEMAVKSINLKKTLFKDVKGIKKFNVTAGDASAVKIKGSTLMVLQDATVTIEAFDKKKEKLAEKTVTVIAPAIDSAQTTEINRRGTLDLNKYILSTVQPSGWKSSNKNVAAVSENGLLIIKKSGTVKLTATFPAEKGMTAKKLTIKLKVKMPQFKKTSYTLKTGKTIKTAVKNADEAGITYRTEDTAIATVDATGSVTGVSKGTTKLIMTVKGIDYETKIKVK